MVAVMVAGGEVNKRNRGKTDPCKQTLMATKKGLPLKYHFAAADIDPMSEEAGIEFERRDATITDMNGKKIFEQKNVMVPKTWSMTATNIVVNKYFRGKVGSKERENSVEQLIGRVVETLSQWGEKSSYFAKKQDIETFKAELAHLLINQKMAFNSPVW